MEAAPEYANIGRMAKRGPLYLEVDRFYWKTNKQTKKPPIEACFLGLEPEVMLLNF
jgi:hypothetical protein